MREDRYVALLRGINVGGNNIIKMADLRASFEVMGFTAVETLIQSGNVVFSSQPANRAELVRAIESALSDRFGYALRVAVLSGKEFERAVAQAPPGFGEQSDAYRYDVLFVMEPLTAVHAVKQVPTNPEVDNVSAGEHALYFRRLISRIRQSRLSRIAQLPVYQSLTIRNWNTTTKLLERVVR